MTSEPPITTPTPASSSESGARAGSRRPAKLKIGYVPEHFASPLLQLAKDDDEIEVVERPSGTGQMITSLSEGSIDVAIALTESLIAGIHRRGGREGYRIVGSYVQSPLNWAVITGKNAPIQSIADVRGKPIGISRIGSGSQVMASYMALHQKWFAKDRKGHETGTVEPLNFVVQDTFQNLRDGVNSNITAAFLWEHFTTKPFVDSGECRFIGNVLTPWPSWIIVASPSVSPASLSSFLDRLTSRITSFDVPEARDGTGPSFEFVKDHFGYTDEDVKNWFRQVRYVEDTKVVDERVIEKVLEILETAGVVRKPENGWDMELFVNTEVAKLVKG